MAKLHTIDELQRVLRYDPETGLFHWRVKRSNSSRADGVAGSCCGENAAYWRLRFDGVVYLAHRVAWLFMTGQWPNGPIDHRDLDKLNNRWANLRAASPTENNANTRGRGKFAKGTTRLPHGRFMAQIKKDGRSIYIGSFDTEADAAAAYAAKATELFGEFARAA